jgi:hypothetical protein
MPEITINCTIIDNGVIGNQIRADSLDLVFANERKAILTEKIIDEYTRLLPIDDERKVKLLEWGYGSR